VTRGRDGRRAGRARNDEPVTRGRDGRRAGRAARALAVSALVAGALAAGAPGCNQLAGTDSFHVDAAGTPPPDEATCTSNAECTDRAAGVPSLCRKIDQKCARIASAECAFFVGNILADDTIIIGAIGPTSGTDVLLGQATQNALSLALQDFSTGGGLPPAAPGGPPRPLALVGCDESKDPVAAARHLALELGVPAIVGASASGLTAQIAEEVSVPAGALLISPSATSVSLSTLIATGLVRRTAPSDIQQSAALALLAARVADAERPKTSDGAVKVVVLYKSDSYGEGLFEDIARRLKPSEGGGALGLGDRLVGFSYGNPDDLSETPDPAASYAQAVELLVAEAPHLVLALGTTEVVTELLTRIEAAPSLRIRPKYLFPDGGYVPQLGAIVASNETLRQRVLGTRPASLRDAFGAFRERYATSFRDGTAADSVGAAAAFDAFYLVAFGIAALPPGEPVTGAGISLNWARLVPPGASLRFEPDSISDIFAALARGENVDVEGASGPLDFDATGEALSDILVWCPAPADSTVDALPASSGFFLDPMTGTLQGAPSAACKDALPVAPPSAPPTRGDQRRTPDSSRGQ
jgi:branched-chain amino acid transport system substrate-binding protein